MPKEPDQIPVKERDLATVEKPKVELGAKEDRDGVTQYKLKIETAPGRIVDDAYLLVPEGKGPFPAVVVVFYDHHGGRSTEHPMSTAAVEASRGVVATQFGFNGSQSREGRYAPIADPPLNTQIKLSDGINPFAVNALADSVTVSTLSYREVATDAGVKYRGFSFQGEYYWRTLSDFVANVPLPLTSIFDRGFMAQAGYMAIPQTLNVYALGGYVHDQFRRYPWEAGGGVQSICCVWLPPSAGTGDPIKPTRATLPWTCGAITSEGFATQASTVMLSSPGKLQVPAGLR